MMRFTFWRIWLFVACVSMIVLGLVMVFFNQHPLLVSRNTAALVAVLVHQGGSAED